MSSGCYFFLYNDVLMVNGKNNFQLQHFSYPASRVSFDLPRLVGSDLRRSKETLLAGYIFSTSIVRVITAVIHCCCGKINHIS